MPRYGSTGIHGVGLLYMGVCTLYGGLYIIYSMLCTTCKLYAAYPVHLPSPVLYAGYASTGSSAALVQFPC